MSTITQDIEWIERTNKDIISALSGYKAVNNNIEELGFRFTPIDNRTDLEEGSYLLHVNYPEAIEELDEEQLDDVEVWLI